MASLEWNTQQPHLTAQALEQQMMSDPATAAVWTKVKGDYATLAGTIGKVGALLVDTDTQIVTVHADTTRNEQYHYEGDVAVRRAAEQALEALASRAQTAYTTISTTLNSIRVRGLAGGAAGAKATNDDVLAEMRQQAAWQRAARVLDAVREDNRVVDRARVMLENAAADGDKAMLAALFTELPAYFESRRVAMAKAAFDALYFGKVLAALSPEQRAAARLLQDVEAGWRNVQADIGLARGVITGNTPVALGNLTGWGEGESVPVRYLNGGGGVSRAPAKPPLSARAKALQSARFLNGQGGIDR